MQAHHLRTRMGLCTHAHEHQHTLQPWRLRANTARARSAACGRCTTLTHPWTSMPDIAFTMVAFTAYNYTLWLVEHTTSKPASLKHPPPLPKWGCAGECTRTLSAPASKFTSDHLNSRVTPVAHGFSYVRAAAIVVPASLRPAAAAA